MSKLTISLVLCAVLAASAAPQNNHHQTNMVLVDAGTSFAIEARQFSDADYLRVSVRNTEEGHRQMSKTLNSYAKNVAFAEALRSYMQKYLETAVMDESQKTSLKNLVNNVLSDSNEHDRQSVIADVDSWIVTIDQLKAALDKDIHQK